MSDIEAVACYSYRNINRIYKAVYKESVGESLQRLRIEAQAKAILYTATSITEIAYQAGFSDLQAFNKAFKKLYGQSPLQYRKQKTMQARKWLALNEQKIMEATKQLQYRTETVPDLNVVYLAYQGQYDDEAIQQHWQSLLEYASKHQLIDDQSVYFGEVLDDEDTTHLDRCRYNCAITLKEGQQHSPEGFVQQKTIASRHYAVFTHQGPYNSMQTTYELIYGHWLLQKPFDLEDAPVLEFYLNDEAQVTASELLTEIYVPIKPQAQ